MIEAACDALTAKVMPKDPCGCDGDGRPPAVKKAEQKAKAEDEKVAREQLEKKKEDEDKKRKEEAKIEKEKEDAKKKTDDEKKKAEAEIAKAKEES